MATLVSPKVRKKQLFGNFSYCSQIISQIKRYCQEQYSNSSWVDQPMTYLILKCGRDPSFMMGGVNYLERQGCFKVVTVKETEYDEKAKRSTYMITYKDLDLSAPSLRHLEKYDKNIDRLTYNDKHRFEEERAYSGIGITQYDGLVEIPRKKISDWVFDNEIENLISMSPEELKKVVKDRQTFGKYEMLDKNDDCMFELFVKQRGFNNVQEFADYCRLENIDDETLDALYREFLEWGKANPWELGEDSEEDEE